MEFDLRQWLLILGPVFIVVVLLHGYWRMRNSRNNLKMALDKNFLSQPGDEGKVDDLSLFKAELPNGGARIIKTAELDSSQDVPVLMEPVERRSVEEQADEALEEELAGVLEEELEDALEDMHFPDTFVESTSVEGTSVEDTFAEDTFAEDTFAEDTFAEDTFAEDTAADSVAESTAADTAESVSVTDSVGGTPSKAPPARKADQSEKFIVINVLADDEFFNGQQLLETLVNLDMSFGDMNVFHRLNEDGFSEFSLANAVEPGTFDLADMDSMQTPGITMFMRVHELADPEHVFEELINVATVLSEELGGTIKDQTRSVMTMQTIEHCRQEIRDFQFRHSA